MNIGGMGMKAASMRLQKPKKKSDRRRLYYPNRSEKCTHCAHLGERKLQDLLDTIDEHQE